MNTPISGTVHQEPRRAPLCCMPFAHERSGRSQQEQQPAQLRVEVNGRVSHLAEPAVEDPRVVNLFIGVVACLLFLAGSALQIGALSSGAYQPGRPLRDRLKYGLPSVLCFVLGLVLFLLTD